ncbi:MULTISPECIES: hypothetical protein [Nostoc]|uniref:Uncharacterized protein n=1 Tax=Nostoc paludosum FACHB-159 TaxID=2692908 RepID=A0ABR8K414_9NOSO|nr:MULTISPECIES: hypothetical protein [Nostoc]MBD2677418.1 hypothetical protein [Nostoc sp. FACHB-857]MBD2734188.1 hypothetical protein [Nostoc paludosum FACHB-159]
MKTIVYQSYHGDETPAWLETCMQTVKNWAELKGFDYQRKDNFFDYVPDWYQEKSQGKINIIADLARLEIAKEFLEEGYDQTIWMDADIVVFDPDKLTIETTEDYLLCREFWLDTEYDKNFGEGPIFCLKKVTNSMVFFKKRNDFLDFYIYACKSIMKNHTGNLSRLAVSTKFLSKLSEIIELPLFLNMGLFSPILMHGLVEDETSILQLYAEALESPVYAANLCLSFRNQCHKGIMVTDQLFEEVIDKLIRTKGETINRYLSPALVV